MTYQESLEYIEKKNSLGIHPGLERISAVLSQLQHPEQGIPVIQIAGTNGKGTIMSFLEAAFLEQGIRVGRYISPAITEYRERWTVNREMPAEETVAKLLAREKEAEESAGVVLTSFEAETVAGLLLYQQEKCDLLLIECGMGGRLDATNVFPGKLVDIIASVSLDHMQYLGNTREEILIEKLGIVKPGDELVTSPLDDILRSVLIERKLSFTEAVLPEETVIKMNDSGTDFSWNGMELHISMAGQAALENAVTALTALQAYNRRAEEVNLPQVSRDSIRKAFYKMYWPARFTVLRHQPAVIVDGAHNRDAWKKTAETMLRFYRPPFILVMGVLKDKEVDCMVETFAPLAKKIYCFTPDSPRALPGAELAVHFREKGISAEEASSAETALFSALDVAGPEDTILAAGSLTFVGGLLQKREQVKMHRITRILHDPEYIGHMRKILRTEYDRLFCHHGFGHAVSVARIAYILAMEENLPYSKEMLYAVALLHDVGRYTELEKSMSHHEAGAILAEDYLIRAGFTEEERKEICNAIREHKEYGGQNGTLSGVLYRADKLSRNCFLCDAQKDCYWPEERKNQTIRV